MPSQARVDVERPEQVEQRRRHVGGMQRTGNPLHRRGDRRRHERGAVGKQDRVQRPVRQVSCAAEDVGDLVVHARAGDGEAGARQVRAVQDGRSCLDVVAVVD